MAKKGTGGAPGRKPGTNKKVVNARKVLRTQQDLEERISDDAVEAYNVIYEVMSNSSAPPASRRAAAGDILGMFNRLKENSDKVLEDFNSKLEDQDSKEGNGDQDDNVRPLFQFDD